MTDPTPFLLAERFAYIPAGLFWMGEISGNELPSGLPAREVVVYAGFTSPVGAFPPNAYGLYDMAGNVLEWCWDNYYAPETFAKSVSSGEQEKQYPVRVARGGCSATKRWRASISPARLIFAMYRAGCKFCPVDDLRTTALETHFLSGCVQ